MHIVTELKLPRIGLRIILEISQEWTGQHVHMTWAQLSNWASLECAGKMQDLALVYIEEMWTAVKMWNQGYVELLLIARLAKYDTI